MMANNGRQWQTIANDSKPWQTKNQQQLLQKTKQEVTVNHHQLQF